MTSATITTNASAKTGAGTLAEAVLVSLTRLVSTPDGEVPPAAILWTDAEGQWKSLVALLRSRVPHLYELGTFAPDDHIGPAIWLVCAVARTLADHSPPAGTVPILYLPGVARQDLRAGADCPVLHQPLVELQYRGKVWHQRNGRDWTIEAFLTSKDALDLDVARDAASQQAMLRAIDRLADEPLAALAGRRLDVGFF
ncbi:MAG: BREX-1 system phosphatase PglZ type B, partial [Planctomycetes bacterium]|nr:BREX-1 system phosphatase PglZ type B [Planctomycetota bacterium]